MKTIEPISIWDKGTNQEASILTAYCINDNLSSSAIFYYSLLSDSMQQLAQDNLFMSGEDYVAWQTNDYAYDWVASQLNLNIIGDYVPTVVEPIVPEVTPQSEPIIPTDNNLE